MGNFDRAQTGSTRPPSYLQADVLDDLHSARDDATGTRVATMTSGPGERCDFFLSVGARWPRGTWLTDKGRQGAR